MSHQKAFTLIEMLVVVMIIGILSSFVLIQINSSINEGKDVKRKADIELLANAVVSYASDHYSSKPVTDTDGCEIGIDCGTEIENSLKVYLPTLPNDPNTGTAYVYQSDGNDCTISATLSDNTVYQYSCSSDSMVAGTPTNGVCGSAANTYNPGTTSFVGEFCDSGIANPETPVFPTVDGTYVEWQCPGTYLGDSTTCTAYRGADGVCGDVTRTTITAYLPTDTAWPSSNYCSTGTASSTPTFPLEGELATWSCLPLYAGDTASCEAYRGQDGVCGSSSVNPNDNFYLSSEINNPCSTGTVSTITTTLPATDYFKWTCSGIYTGSSSPQCAADLKVDGACGSANGGYYETVPAESIRCANGTTPTNTNLWTWGCEGLNGGTNTGGTILPTPAVATCAANQRQTCSALGGTMTTCGSNPCCQIPLAACPAGWSYSGYNTTYSTVDATYCIISIGTCLGSTGGNPQAYVYTWITGCPSPTGTCYCAGSHSTLTNFPGGKENAWMYNTCWPGYDYRYATITSVGCY